MSIQSSSGRNLWLVPAVLALAIHLPFASGCVEGTAESVGDALALAAMPPAREEQMGEQMKQKLVDNPEITLLPENGENQEVHSYVDKLGQKAVQAAEQVDTSTDSGFDNTTSAAVYNQIDFNFHVVEKPSVNAFAMAGGEIYIHTGLLREAETEAEVMAVMAHEVAHVTERHIAKQMLAVFATKFAAEKASEKLSEAADGKADKVINLFVERIATRGVIKAFGRKQENSSDEKGVAYMAEANYNPQGFVSFFKRLQEAQGEQQGFRLFSSHPPPSNRIENVQDLIKENNYQGETVGESNHQSVRKSLQ